MKRIFGFIGSPLKEKSNTYHLTKMMVERLQEKDRDIVYEIYTAGHIKLNFCQGCWTCMTKGYHLCPQDKLDDMAMLKKKMLEADFIILGSPIHTAHMSGQMKTFFDRLAAWYHVLMLAGKPGATVITTGSIHQDELHGFFEMLMGCLGIKSVARLNAVSFSPGVFLDFDEAKKRSEEAAETIYPYVTGKRMIDSDEHMEHCFNAVKSKVISGKKWLAGHKYWKDNDMLDLHTYEQLLERIRSL